MNNNLSLHGGSKKRYRGRGNPGRGNPGRGNPGRGNPGRGNPGRGNPGRGNPGRGNPGRGNPGRGNPGRGNPGRGNPNRGNKFKWYNNKNKPKHMLDKDKPGPLNPGNKNKTQEVLDLLKKAKQIDPQTQKSNNSSNNNGNNSKSNSNKIKQTKKLLRNHDKKIVNPEVKKNSITQKKMIKRLEQVVGIYKKMITQLKFNKYKDKMYNREFYDSIKQKTNIDIKNFKTVKYSSSKKN